MILLTRKPKKNIQKYKQYADKIQFIESFDLLNCVPDIVINLAGEGIADRRWSTNRKLILRDSRIGITNRLADRLKGLGASPKTVISGSAVGYYGTEKKGICVEKMPPGDDFSANMCRDWEDSAKYLAGKTTELYHLRIGIVMGRPGGFIGRLEVPFFLGLGGVLGDGQQMMSWIHRDDLIAMVLWLLRERPPVGVYNATSPKPASNETFTNLFAKAIKRPAFLRIPEVPMRLLFGDLADLLFKGQAVYPKRALDQGFVFQYADLEEALNNLFR